MIKTLRWKKFIYELVKDYCIFIERRTFELKEFWDYNEKIICEYSVANNYPYQKTCEMFQKLRDDGVLFFNERGKYTLLKPEFLANELSLEVIIKNLDNNKKEYIREFYVRDTKLIKEVKKKFNYQCINPKCKNVFITENGTPYAEVHHIIPLFQNGEDDIDNLAVLCAHHHKMAHFAQIDIKVRLQDLYLDIISKYD